MTSTILKVLLVSLSGVGAWDCPLLPPNTPASVHDLQANDIKVMLALGDSITAGFGINGIEGALSEFRGRSWSIGGDPGQVTLPNYFRHFNTTVLGPSTGRHFVEICYGPLCPPLQHNAKLDRLSGAQSGALIKNVIPQVDYILKQMNADPDIDSVRDWKHLTLLVGANDLCISCIQPNILSPDSWEQNMRTILDKIRKNIPRVVVSVVGLFNVSQVYDLSLQSPYCKNVHRIAFVECDCAFGPNGKKHRVEMDTFAALYNERTKKVVDEYRSNPEPDFAVVLQPFAQDFPVKVLPPNFLSSLDCFHPSLVAHQMMATNLWNSLWTPVDKKTTFFDPTAVPFCPDAKSRIQT